MYSGESIALMRKIALAKRIAVDPRVSATTQHKAAVSAKLFQAIDRADSKK